MDPFAPGPVSTFPSPKPLALVFAQQIRRGPAARRARPAANAPQGPPNKAIGLANGVGRREEARLSAFCFVSGRPFPVPGAQQHRAFGHCLDQSAASATVCDALPPPQSPNSTSLGIESVGHSSPTSAAHNCLPSPFPLFWPLRLFSCPRASGFYDAPEMAGADHNRPPGPRMELPPAAGRLPTTINLAMAVMVLAAR